MAELPQSQELPEEEPTTLLKPRKTRAKQNLSDEQRKQRSEHMKKVNAERIAKAKERNEKVLEAKVEAIQKKADEKKATIQKQIPQKNTPAPPADEPKEEVVAVAKKQKKKTIKIVNQPETDDESEDEIVIVNKVPKKRTPKPAPFQEPAPKKPETQFRFV